MMQMKVAKVVPKVVKDLLVCYFSFRLWILINTLCCHIVLSGLTGPFLPCKKAVSLEKAI